MHIKKVIFYIPALVLTIFYTWAAIDGIGAIHPIVLVWLLLLWGAGIFLSKNMAWGGIFGIIPAICFIYLSTQSNGQTINLELPLGIIILLYYSVCGFVVYKKNRIKNKP